MRPLPRLDSEPKSSAIFGQLFISAALTPRAESDLAEIADNPKLGHEAGKLAPQVNQAFVLEDEDLSHRALGLFRSSNVDYSDCVILSNCRARNLDLYTFDKRLSKLAGASPVSV